MIRYILIIILIVLIYYFGKIAVLNSPSNRTAPKEKLVPEAYLVNFDNVANRLKEDVRMLAGTIGARSLFHPDNLKQAKDFIKSRMEKYGMVKEYPYTYSGTEVANIELDIFSESSDNAILIIGAHYDTVTSTPGADDNASSVAVLLELAKQAKRVKDAGELKENLRFLAFTLEEPPAFYTPKMGSRQYVKIIKQKGEKIKGMICLEMVGYKSIAPYSQQIPFPLNFRNYPRTGDFIAFVANISSLSLLNQLISCTKYKNTLLYEKLVVPGKGRMLPISRMSDHIAFWDKGYPAVMITDTAFLRNPNYHNFGDKPETLDYHFMAQLVQTLMMLFSRSLT